VIKILSATLLSLSLATVAGGVPASPAFAQMMAVRTDRPPADVARDAERKPAAVIAFTGVKPGMTVAELLPGTGYYTRLLAKAVGPKGKVYAILPASLVSALPGAVAVMKSIEAQYPNVHVVLGDLNAIALPEKVDVFWTTENYHDLHAIPNADIAAFNHSVYESLKPGGVFLVEDHSAPAGSTVEVTSRLHRINETMAVSELEAAGFQVQARSDLLRNPGDDRTLISHDPGIKGHTDRFLLRLTRP
jgi:predicted methyltransferase